MEIFEKLGSITKSAVDKTANKVTIARINSRISTLKSGMGAQKLRIGEHYWLKHKDDKSFDPEVAEVFNAIENYLAQIESCESEIRLIIESEEALKTQNMPNMPKISGEYGSICPSCGERSQWGAKFCRGCGQPLNAPNMSNTPNIAAGGIKCANCGAEMEDDAVFCGVCGIKL
jgi:ribosomal protein L40E